MVRGGICSFAALSSAAAGGSAVSERPPFLLPPFDPGADPALTAADAAAFRPDATLQDIASAYERVLGSEPKFTTWKIRSGAFKPGEAKMCIDYVFASPGVEIVDVAALPSERDVGAKALPCAEHPSDHLMLRYSRFRPGFRARATNRKSTVVKKIKTFNERVVRISDNRASSRVTSAPS